VERLAEMFLLWEEGDEVVGFAAFQPDEGYLSVFQSPANGHRCCRSLRGRGAGLGIARRRFDSLGRVR
jgi:hypothetical protein